MLHCGSLTVQASFRCQWSWCNWQFHRPQKSFHHKGRRNGSLSTVMKNDVNTLIGEKEMAGLLQISLMYACGVFRWCCCWWAGALLLDLAYLDRNPFSGDLMSGTMYVKARGTSTSIRWAQYWHFEGRIKILTSECAKSYLSRLLNVANDLYSHVISFSHAAWVNAT